MFSLFTKVGPTFKGAFFQYTARIIRTEEVPDKFDITRLFPIWKKIVLNTMRYIHSKEWDARLIDALITEHMKPNITQACPNIQIGGMLKLSSVEHLPD